MKICSTIIVLFAVVFLLAVEFSWAQTTAITEQDYWAGIRSGYATTRDKFPRRETTTYESLSGEKVTYSRTEISEYRSKDIFHIVKTVVRDGATVITEMIQIGSSRYCRDNGSEWKSSGCYFQPPAPLDKADETKYSVQTNKDGRILMRNATFLEKEIKSNEPITYLTEDKVVLNYDMSVRERSIIKVVKETRNIASRATTLLEYGVDLKPIESPIK